MGLLPRGKNANSAGRRLQSYASQRTDYLMYVGSPPSNPIRWSRIRELTDENAVTEDGSTVPLSTVDAFLVAYPNGQLLDQNGAERLSLPQGIRGLEVRVAKRRERVRLEDLKRGEAFLRITFSATAQVPKRPGYYSTILTNVGAEAIRILHFTPCRNSLGPWISGNSYSADEFLAWYGREGRDWLPPGTSAVDPNNYGDPPILWAYYGETKSGVTFVAGAVLDQLP